MNINITDKQKLINFLLEITGNNEKDTYYIRNLIDVYPDILEYMINDKMPDLSNVKYVKYKRYEQLKDKVLNNLSLLKLNSFLNDIFPINILKLLISYYENKLLIYDNETLFNIIVKDIIAKPYDVLCRINGLNFQRVDKILSNVNSYNSLWSYDLLSSPQRCVSFIIWFLLNNLNGSTYITIDKLKNAMTYRYNLSDCIPCLKIALTDKRLTLYNDKVMLTQTYLEEKNISKYVQNSIQKYNETNFNINTNLYRQLHSFTLTDNQMKTLELINKHQLVLLNGFAGTGKSSSIKALINMLEDNDKTYVIISPTAKAAKQMSMYTQRPASTIHYLLCSEFPNFDISTKDKSDYEIASGKVDDNNYDSFNDKLDYDVIIIDETSMLSVTLFNTLLKYVSCKRSKMLLIGDSYQLPSIQNGNLYQDLLEIEDIPKVTLDEIFRYNEDGLITVATNIRLGVKYLDNTAVQKIGTSFEFYQHDNVTNMINAALNKYIDLINEGNDIQDIAILTAKNVGMSGTNVINSCIQTIINPIDEFDDFISIKVDNQTIRFKENDIVMNIKNNYNAVAKNSTNKTLIANGQTGRIKYVNPINNTLGILIDDKEFEFEYADICNLRLAYCFTIHKSQGSQFKNVIYVVTSEDMFMTNSNLMYVAVTRAKEKCFQFGAKHVINYKINEKENLKRNTTLKLQYMNT